MAYERAPLADELVGMVMLKMALTYGRKFTQQSDMPHEAVRAHWAQELAGISREGVLYAMTRLPADYVPNVLQFRALAANRPIDSARALPAPEPSPERRARFLATTRALGEAIKEQPAADPLAWAQRIVDNQRSHSRAARTMAIEALRAKGRLP
jgi:hypothetical protein